MSTTSTTEETHNNVALLERKRGRTTYGSQPDIRENYEEMILDGDLAVVMPETLDVRSEKPVPTTQGIVGLCPTDIKSLQGGHGIGDFHREFTAMLFVCRMTIGWIMAGAAVLMTAELPTHRVLTSAPNRDIVLAALAVTAGAFLLIGR